MASVAPHYSPEAFKFMRGLKRNNDREWFNTRKAIYEREIKAPTLALITAINEAMLRFAPENVQPPQKVAMRIYRDIRFSSDKRPYKRNQGAWWACAGLEKTSGGGFYFHFGPDEVVIAAGVYMPEREQLLAIRRHLEIHHKEMRRLLNSKKLRSLLSEFEGQKLTRPPKGFPPDSPAMDLLLCRQWGVSAHLPPSAATTPTLLKEIVKRFEVAAPIVALLNAPLVATKPRKPLF
ncbi:DUF2461 domain-containing protein [Edaphobacter modestus]|uniref:Uncharacterized protein (TIGR02453 family) n=1 Tax=Edaphobacter modestus TaxID=388466 RepID=A0A4Q7YVN5_9BACT|nr:DUF2461 domain-containing protein [Edaphobacter modestus]RZU41718.1 uncharacterized protein (TIGR02453 family) [Edaphobacter modestus]